MEDRYEIRGKIGQGGIGSVHRAYDHRMKREVAIKRILTSNEDIHLESEATKQLMTEVSALASLQHPHIVTVFDVGSDEQGPYIVMELINGKTLDEIVEQAPLVWHDFKVVAMQSLEALIAAQELDMIHSDLKPPNIMLTWLPSGAFQVKIVDFGLAVLVQNQSQEEIEKMEAIYGSIFFMPPEQYERKTLDTRSDLYSLGCCFYQALAGTYPFNGQTGMEVMQAHLNHKVTHLKELRSDIPLWACDWVMWLINRFPDDRPSSAREALANFLQQDKESNPVMSRGGATTGHPKLIIPSATGPVIIPVTSPVPTQRHTASYPTLRNTSATPTSPAIQTATAGHPIASTSPVQVSGLPKQDVLPQQKKSSKKILAILVCLVLLALFGGGAAWWFMKDGVKGRSKQEQAFNQIAARAERSDVDQLPLTSSQLKTVMNYIVNNPYAYLTPALSALAKAKTTDATDIDAAILEFALTSKIPPKVRERLFEEVIAKRAHAASIPSVIDFSSTTAQAGEAIAAFNAVRDRLSEEHAAGVLRIISSTDHNEVRLAAEIEFKELISDAQDPNALAGLISQAIQNTTKNKARPILERLLERAKSAASAPKPSVTSAPAKPSTPKPPTNKPQSPPKPKPGATVDQLVSSFDSSDDAGKSNIIASLTKIPTKESHQALNDISQTTNVVLRSQAIKALTELNSNPTLLTVESDASLRWQQIIWRAKSTEEKSYVIEALAKIDKEWAIDRIKQMVNDSDPAIHKLAQDKLKEIQDNRKEGGN